MSLDVNVLSKEHIQMMWQIRKLIRSEFNSEVKISDRDALEQLVRFEDLTSNPKLKLLISSVLTKAAPKPMITENSAQQQVEKRVKKASKRVYRGQVIQA